MSDARIRDLVYYMQARKVMSSRVKPLIRAKVRGRVVDGVEDPIYWIRFPLKQQMFEETKNDAGY